MRTRSRFGRRLLDSVSARLLAIILFSVVPLSVLAALTAWHNYQSTLGVSSHRSAIMAEALKAQSDQQIADMGRVLDALSRRPELRDPSRCDSIISLARELETVPLVGVGLWDANGQPSCGGSDAMLGAGRHPVTAPGARSMTLLPILSGDGLTDRPVLRLTLTQGSPASLGTLVADMKLGWTRAQLDGSDLWRDRLGTNGDSEAWLVGPSVMGSTSRLVPLCGDCGWTAPTWSALQPDRFVDPGHARQGHFFKRGMVGDLGLLVITRQSRGEIAALSVFLRHVAAIMLLLVLGVVAVAIGANILIVAPLRAVTRSVTEWRRAGAYDPRHTRLTPIELRQLSRAFSQATRSLAAHEERLRKAEEKQELLIKEIHHRVKNNLQIIASLLNLQANRIRQPEARAEFASARDRVRALATLHRHLYSEGELHTLNMRSFLLELCGQLFQAIGEKEGRRIRLEIEAPEIVMSTDQAVPLALVVTEAVSNAIKYAFPGGRSGVVSVRLAEEVTGIATLVIEDNGIGIPAGRAETETGIRDGLGITLIRGFARQLGATLEVIEGPELDGPDDASATSSGTRYTLMVPLHPKVETYTGVDDEPSPPAPATGAHAGATA